MARLGIVALEQISASASAHAGSEARGGAVPPAVRSNRGNVARGRNNRRGMRGLDLEVVDPSAGPTGPDRPSSATEDPAGGTRQCKSTYGSGARQAIAQPFRLEDFLIYAGLEGNPAGIEGAARF